MAKIFSYFIICFSDHPLSNPSWRHSQPTPEVTYGFHPGRVYPSSCHYLSSMAAPTGAVSSQSGAAPQYVWDPPPPYTQPATQGLPTPTPADPRPSNPTTNATSMHTQTTPNHTQTTPNQPTSSTSSSGHTPRTTKSGLLNPDCQSASSTENTIVPDNSVDSAMHLYDNSNNNCHSLPSRNRSRSK